MNNLKQYRIRTIEAIKANLANQSSQEVKAIDYKLDDLAREILSLPPKPQNALPYVGWLGANKPTPEPIGISQAGIDLIKRWEGFRSNAYLCPGNVWTIGYGHTKNVYQGMCISKAQAEELLKEDLKHFEASVRQFVTVKLNQAQFDALVSFTFNVGVYAFKKSTLLRLVNQGDFLGAAKQFGRWVNANGKKLPGLVSRREEEKKLFLS